MHEIVADQASLKFALVVLLDMSHMPRLNLSLPAGYFNSSKNIVRTALLCVKFHKQWRIFEKMYGPSHYFPPCCV